MIGLRKRATAAVTDLLEAQHKALLVGDLEALGKMTAALEKAFASLGKEGGDRAALAQIKDAAARNARLLTAAQAGIAAARGHLSKGRSPGLTTYDASGRTQASAASHSRDLARR